MREQTIYRLASWVCCGLLGLVLLAGWSKALDPETFSWTVYRYHVLPGVLINGVAIWLPWLELVTALTLFFIPPLRRAGLWIALVLMALFTFAVAYNLWRGSPFGCGCFGSSSQEPLGPEQLLRNLCLTALAILGLVARRRARG